MATFPSPGDDFGRYHVEKLLGRGGMGVVYACVDSRVERSVALKVLNPMLSAEPEFRARFAHEARVLARLDSPHIVQVFDYGEIDDCLYLATQLVPDGDLGALLGGPELADQRVAVGLVAQVCDALADAHAAGVVHRDVKPRNVLIRRRGPDLHAYLCDFGIAWTEGSEHTRTGVVAGSMAYMAPERHEGVRADERSDIYSVGCLLWSTLTGGPPFTGTDSQVALAHLQNPPPTLPYIHETSAALNDILQRALAKDPAARFQSARELGNALRAVLNPTATGQAAALAETLFKPGSIPAEETFLKPPSLATPMPTPPLPTPAPTPAPAGKSPLLIGGLVAALVGIIGALVFQLVNGDDVTTAADLPTDSSSSAPSTSAEPAVASEEPEEEKKSTPSPAKPEKPPLTLNASYENQPCSDDYIVMLASSGNAAEYKSKLGAAVSGIPGAKFLQGAKSCRAFLNKDPGTGDQVYNAYLGPFPSVAAACQARSTLGSAGAWVRKLSNPSKEREACFCLTNATELPQIGAPGVDTSSLPIQQLISQVQWPLFKMGLNSRLRLAGNYSSEFAASVRSFQSRNLLTPTGRLDTATWRSLQDAYCPDRAFEVTR